MLVFHSIFSVYVKSYSDKWSAQRNQNSLLSLKVPHLILTLLSVDYISLLVMEYYGILFS